MKYLVHNQKNDSKWECDEKDLWKYVALRLNESSAYAVHYESGTYWIVDTRGNRLAFSVPIVTIREIEEYVLTVVDTIDGNDEHTVTQREITSDEDISVIARKVDSEIQRAMNMAGTVKLYPHSVEITAPSKRTYLFTVSKGKSKIPVSQYIYVVAK